MFIFFWPFMLSSVILSLLAIVLYRPRFMYIAAFLIIPTALYAAAGIGIRKNKRWLSVLFSLPVYMLIGWMAIEVLNQ